MSARDILAALSVAIVWGLTFIAIKVGVGQTSPLMLAALRFFFAAVPMVFFLAPPKAPAWTVALYGLLIGVGQFGVLFVAVHQGFPVGLASLVVMAQVFFTILLAWIWLGERPRRAQIIGAAVGFARHGRHRFGTARGSEPRAVPARHSGGCVLGLRQRAGEERRQGQHARLHRLVEPGRAAAPARAVACGRGDGRPCRARPSGLEAHSQRAGAFPMPVLCSATAYGLGCLLIIRRRPSPRSRFWCRLWA